MSDKEFAASVFIGRFQPFHNSHLVALKKALEIADKAIVLIGSSDAARNTKNPWTFEEREKMIRGSLDRAENTRLQVHPIRDYFYHDNIWVAEVQRIVTTIVDSRASIALVGSYKDDSSYYLKMFPQWEFMPAQAPAMNATELRDEFFSGKYENVIHSIPKGTDKVITDWVKTGPHQEMCEEHKFLKDYKAKWAAAPFVPTFVTTDAVVVQSGHVLLVRRKFSPGKGLLALPGGFLRANERIEDGMLRELREETGIKLHAKELRKAIKTTRVFDYPGRSLRGRTITHASLLMLDGGELPEVRGLDDAEKAFWMPLADVYRHPEHFFEDHFSIIDTLLMKGK